MFSVIYVYQNNYFKETLSLLCPEKSASFAMVHFQDIHKNICMLILNTRIVFQSPWYIVYIQYVLYSTTSRQYFILRDRQVWRAGPALHISIYIYSTLQLENCQVVDKNQQRLTLTNKIKEEEKQFRGLARREKKGSRVTWWMEWIPKRSEGNEHYNM